MSASISLLRARRKLKDNSEDDSGDDSDCSIKDLQRKETIEQDARTIAAINMLTVSMVNKLLEERGLDPFGKSLGSSSFEDESAWTSPVRNTGTPARPPSAVRSVKENTYTKKPRKSVRFTPDTTSKMEYPPETNCAPDKLDLVHTISTPVSSLKMEPKFTPIRRSKVLKASLLRSLENEQDMTTGNLDCSESFERSTPVKDAAENSTAPSEAGDPAVRTPLQTVTSGNQTPVSQPKEPLFVTSSTKRGNMLSCNVKPDLAAREAAPSEEADTQNSPNLPSPADNTEENEDCEASFQTPVKTKWCHYFDPTSPEHMSPFLKALFEEREEKNKGTELSKSFSMLESSEDQPKLSVLKGVVAFVEVRRADEDRSSGFRWKLKQLGAQVEENFTKKVTHVVFQEGLLSTYRKAKESNIHLVSACWVMACDERSSRVPEDKYPIDEEDKYSMLAPLKKYLRRPKLMSPDLGNGNDEKRLARRLQAIKRRSMRVEGAPSTEKADADTGSPPTSKMPSPKAKTSPQSAKSSAAKKNAASSSLMSAWLTGKSKTATDSESGKRERSSATTTSSRFSPTKRSPPKTKKLAESTETTALSERGSKMRLFDIGMESQPKTPTDLFSMITVSRNRNETSNIPSTSSKDDPSIPEESQPQSSLSKAAPSPSKSRLSPRKRRPETDSWKASLLSSKNQPSTPSKNRSQSSLTKTAPLPSKPTPRKNKLQNSPGRAAPSPSKMQPLTPRKSQLLTNVEKVAPSPARREAPTPSKTRPSTPRKSQLLTNVEKVAPSPARREAPTPSKTRPSTPRKSQLLTNVEMVAPSPSKNRTKTTLAKSAILPSRSEEDKAPTKSFAPKTSGKLCGKGSLESWLCKSSVSSAKRKASVAFGNTECIQDSKDQMQSPNSKRNPKRKAGASSEHFALDSVVKGSEILSAKQHNDGAAPTKRAHAEDSLCPKTDELTKQPRVSTVAPVKKKFTFGPVKSKKVTFGSGNQPQKTNAKWKEKTVSPKNLRTSSAFSDKSALKNQSVITSHFRSVNVDAGDGRKDENTVIKNENTGSGETLGMEMKVGDFCVASSKENTVGESSSTNPCEITTNKLSETTPSTNKSVTSSSQKRAKMASVTSSCIDKTVISLSKKDARKSRTTSPLEDMTGDSSADIVPENAIEDSNATSEAENKSEELIATKTSEDKYVDCAGAVPCEDVDSTTVSSTENKTCDSDMTKQSENKTVDLTQTYLSDDMSGDSCAPSPPEGKASDSSEPTFSEVGTGGFCASGVDAENSSPPAISDVTTGNFSESILSGNLNEPSCLDVATEVGDVSELSFVEVGDGDSCVPTSDETKVQDSGKPTIAEVTDKNCDEPKSIEEVAESCNEPSHSEIMTRDLGVPTMRDVEVGDTSKFTFPEVGAGDFCVPTPVDTKAQDSMEPTVSEVTDGNCNEPKWTEEVAESCNEPSRSELIIGDSSGPIVSRAEAGVASEPIVPEVGAGDCCAPTQTERKAEDCSERAVSEVMDGNYSEPTSTEEMAPSSGDCNYLEITTGDSSGSSLAELRIDSRTSSQFVNKIRGSSRSCLLEIEIEDSSTTSPSKNTAGASTSDSAENEIAGTRGISSFENKSGDWSPSCRSETLGDSVESSASVENTKSLEEKNPDNKAIGASKVDLTCVRSDNQYIAGPSQEDATQTEADIAGNRSALKRKLGHPFVEVVEDDCDSLPRNEEKRSNSADQVAVQSTNEEIKPVEKSIRYRTRRAMRMVNSTTYD